MTDPNSITHRQINVNGIAVHAAEAGNKDNRPVLFLHGYPENWKSFEGVMHKLKDKYYLLAVDMPGIGNSDPIASGDKRSIAAFINTLLDTLNLNRAVLIGHDIGGMAAFAFIRHFPRKLFKAVMMNTAIPGVSPWEEVKRNPFIWHFSFFAVPSLPEILTAGRQKALFNYFFDTLSADKNAVSEASREDYAAAYSSLSSLKTSFDWYRAFPQDEKDNSGRFAVDIPVLYLRGEKEPAAADDLEKYIQGLKESGLTNIKSGLIPGAGHFPAEEQPEETANAIHRFLLS